MIANMHGMQVGLTGLRRRFQFSLRGATLAQLIDTAKQLDFSSRPLRLDIDELNKLSLPCILHWDLNHFVVLVSIGRVKITILDPSCGERTLSLTEISQHFTGVALELIPTADFKLSKSSPTFPLSQLTGRLQGLKSSLTQILILSLTIQVFSLIAPFFLQWIIDQVLVAADMQLLSVLGIGFMLLMSLQIALSFLRGWSVIYLSSRIEVCWMHNLFSHLLKLPLDFFEKRHLGDITSRLGSMQSIQETLTNQFIEAVIDGIMILITLALMLYYNAKLAIASLLAVTAYIAIRSVAFKPVRNMSEQHLVLSARQHSHLLETLRGIQSLKIAGKEAQRQSAYNNMMIDTINHQFKLGMMALGFNSAQQCVFSIERLAVIWIGALLALDHVFSVGMLIAYLSYRDQFAQRMGKLVDIFVEWRMLRLHNERLADIVLTPPEIQLGNTDSQTPTFMRVEVNSVSFRYAEGDPWIIKDCNFTVEQGESVAIIGASGCGKSTLLKILLGLLSPSKGSVSIGGLNIQKIGPGHIRKIIGAVMQEDQMFAGSLADNISFFDPVVDQARIELAARLAAIHEEIIAMPMGYYSLIGDMGNALSGGQKQRLLLARALYRKPLLLILDEATSHLDTFCESRVNAAIKEIDLTKIIVAHRPETIASANRVLKLTKGGIIEEQKIMKTIKG